MLYFTRLPFPLLTLPILSFGGSCQLQINLWLASGCHLFDEWLPSGCHPIKWSEKRKIEDRENRNAQRHVQNEERRSLGEIGSGHGRGRSGCRYRTLQRGQPGRPSAGERQMPMGAGRRACSAFFGQTDLKGKKTKELAFPPLAKTTKNGESTDGLFTFRAFSCIIMPI